jgi:integrase
VQGFVNSLAIYELPTIYHTTCVLRRALRYLYAQGIITTDLSTVVPKLRYCKKAKIPSAYSKDEIERMVNRIDRGNPRGKRDYALILLAARLGLRARCGDNCAAACRTIGLGQAIERLAGNEHLSCSRQPVV